MSERERNPALTRVEAIVRSLRPVLSRRAPRPLAEIDKRLARLREARWRIAVAGAQGNGKSSLVRALLASPKCPQPPVPVSEREETRIPVLYRRGTRPLLRDLGGTGRRTQAGNVDEAAIRRRASVDRRLLDQARFRGLDAVEVELPDIALDAEVDLVDLPGVAGNLANVSKWATKNLLERGSQGVIFVVRGHATIETTAEEANLIRAFGPLMARTIFVQNVWSGHDDDNDATERLNLEFLRRHLGPEPVRYFQLDILAAYEAARRGDPAGFGPLLDALSPFYRRDVAELALDEATRLQNIVDEIMRAYVADRLGAVGRFDAARRAADAIQREREKVAAALADLTRAVRDECGKAKVVVRGAVAAAVTELENALDQFIQNESGLQQDVFEREVARQVGRLQRAVRTSLETEVRSLVERVKAHSREVLGRVDTSALSEPEIQLDAPRLARALERQILGVVKRTLGLVASAGGVLAGAFVGAELGALGGPIGAVIGGVLGLFVGWLANSALDATLGRQLGDTERAEVRRQLKLTLANTRSSLLGTADTAIDGVESQLSQTISVFREDREAVLVERRTQVARGGDLARLDREMQILASARRDLENLLQSTGEEHP